MDNLTKEEIDLRLDKLKSRVSDINSKYKKYNEELDTRYEFAKELGIKKNEDKSKEEITEKLDLYIKKANEIQEELKNNSDNENTEKIEILNNILYLDDLRFGSINELIEESKELSNKEYINRIVERANQLIREEELNEIDSNIYKLSKKGNFIDKITGRDKVKKVLLENYSLKRNEVMNKKYIPNDKSILEIVNITKNCGYNSQDISDFIQKLSTKFDIEDLTEKALTVIDKKVKIPFFYNKEFVEKISAENENMLEKIQDNRSKTKVYKEFEFSDEALKNGISSLELFEYNNLINEVI